MEGQEPVTPGEAVARAASEALPTPQTHSSGHKGKRRAMKRSSSVSGGGGRRRRARVQRTGTGAANARGLAAGPAAAAVSEESCTAPLGIAPPRRRIGRRRPASGRPTCPSASGCARWTRRWGRARANARKRALSRARATWRLPAAPRDQARKAWRRTATPPEKEGELAGGPHAGAVGACSQQRFIALAHPPRAAPCAGLVQADARDHRAPDAGRRV
jgi:hypothetical protein